MLQITHPKEGDTFSLLTDAHRRFIADEKNRAMASGNLTFHWYALVKEGTDNSAPAPVLFAWEADEKTASSPGLYFLLVSEKQDLQDPIVSPCEAMELDLYNLKTGTEYFAAVQKEGERSPTVRFRTADEVPRCIYCEGLPNVRDMGGYRVNGGKIRQGLIYRGGETETHIHPTKEGFAALRQLGLRTEIDMRGEAVGKVHFTAMELLGVKRELLPQCPYEEMLAETNKDACRAFFSVLSDPASYPVYFHCWGGADRTGSFAYILGALLGMSRDDLIFDYEFTSLSVWGMRSRNYDKFQQMEEELLSFPGRTLTKKVEYFLVNRIGITARQIHAIRNILIEKEKPKEKD